VRPRSEPEEDELGIPADPEERPRPESRRTSSDRPGPDSESRAEELLRYFVKHTPAAVAMFDRQLRYLLVSDRWLKDYRFEGSDIIGRVHPEVFPDFQDRWRAVLERCLEGAIERCKEDKITRADGTVDYIRWEVHPWRDDSGQIGGLIAFSELITEQKRAEVELRERTAELERLSSDLKVEVAHHEQTQEVLREAEEELRLTFENAPLGIATTALTGHFLWANPAFCKMMGYSEDEILELTFTELTHPEDLEVSCSFFDRLAAGHIPSYALRKRYVRKNGDVLEGMLHCVCIHDAENRPKMVVAQIEDQTERIETEQEARRQREQMAHIDRLNIMGEMAAGIAHEINQPLTAVATYSQACQRMIAAGTTSDSEVLDVLGKISGEALRAGNIVHRLRALAGEHKSSRTECDVNDLIEEVSELASADARHQGITLELDLDDALPSIVADRIQIQQVALNLIRNALDATDSALCTDCRVVVKTRRVGQEVQISVIDHGIGLATEVEKQLFRTFFTTKETGMGMGLPISRSIVTSHGGRLWFTRNEDQGVTFSFTLPPLSEDDDEAI
jgi:PAS domain S-box-containing protein